MEINFTISQFPEGYCFTTPNQFAVDLVTRLAGEVAGDANFFNDGDTTPAPDFQDRPWLPHNYSGNNPPAFVYQFIDGAWRMPHPLAPGAVMMYEGSEASITTHDGGEAGAITATTGPMWEKVPSMDARFPIGPGTLASGATVAIGGQGGVEEHTLTRAELPNVSVDTLSQRRINVQDGGSAVVTTPETAPTGAAFSNIPLPTEPLGDGDPHTNMPPYTGIWFIRRTARRYFRR